jgi:aldose 1-epimerase
MSTSATSALTLQAGPLRLALRPDLGGAIAGFWHGGHGQHGSPGDLPILRSTEPAALQTAREAASYPLVPYSGRLGYRRFRWQGADHTTAPNSGDSPHSLHGVAWQRAHQVLSASEREAVLHYTHTPDAHWPFAFDLQQRFVLTEDTLTLHLQAINRAPAPQPMGLGWHPYFPKRSRSRIHAEVGARWDADASNLPTRSVPQPGIDADVAHLAFDHCFEGWKGPARVRDEKLSLRIASSLPYLVVYTPQDKPYFCVEPVSHVPNAIHMSDPAAHGLRSLQPGEGFEAWMTIEVAAV